MGRFGLPRPLIFQWGVLDYQDLFSFDKSHFDNTFAESSATHDFYDNALIACV